MTALGDRLVILLIAITGIAGVFAFWSGYIEAMFEGWLKWGLRGLTVLIFLILVAVIWRRSRITKETT